MSGNVIATTTTNSKGHVQLHRSNRHPGDGEIQRVDCPAVWIRCHVPDLNLFGDAQGGLDYDGVNFDVNLDWASLAQLEGTFSKDSAIMSLW